MRLTLLLMGFILATQAFAGEDKVEEKPRFDVMEYQIEGNSVLPVIAVEEMVYPWLGEKKNVDDVEHARADLERAYHDAGYSTVLVDIPEQKVDSGIIHLKVTEGTISKVRVTGSRYFSQGRILAKTPSIAEGSVPYFPDLQKDIASVNTTADRRVTPILKAGKTPGTVDVDLKVDDKLPLHASLELNDRHGANTTPWRAIGMVRYDNLWQREHSLSLQYQTAPKEPSQVAVFSASYLIPLSDKGDALAMYAIRTRSDVAAVGDITVQGNGTIYGIRRIVPLPGSSQLFHSLSFGADYKDFKEDLALRGSDSFSTPISYLPFSLSYNATSQLEPSLTQYNLSANFAVRGLSNKPEEFGNKRYLAQPNYFYLSGEVEHSSKLFGNYSYMAKIGGQWSDQPLISNEQYGAGGADTVRGYLESEAMGDDALHATIELRSPSVANLISSNLDDLHFLVFLDSAALRVTDPLPQQKSRYTLTSAGFGARLKAWRNLSASFDLGRAFRESANTHSGDIRMHFRMLYEF